MIEVERISAKTLYAKNQSTVAFLSQGLEEGKLFKTSDGLSEAKSYFLN